MRIAGQTWCAFEEITFCVLTLDRDLASWLLRLRESVKSTLAINSCRAVEFADQAPSFFEEAGNEDIQEDLWDNGQEWICVSDDFAPDLKRMDWCSLYMNDKAMWWVGRPRHRPYTVETPSIEWEIVEKMSADQYSTCKCGHDQLNCDEQTICKACKRIGCWIADIESDTGSIPTDQLKKMNSRPESVTCHQCGGKLETPWVDIKFCPSCEK